MNRVLVVVALMAMCTAAYADDMLPPDWRGEDNTTTTKIEDWHYYDLPGQWHGLLYESGITFSSNPPLYDGPKIWWYDYAGYKYYAHHANFKGMSGVMRLWNPLGYYGYRLEIPNFPDANPIKKFRYQITYYDPFNEGRLDYAPSGFSWVPGGWVGPYPQFFIDPAEDPVPVPGKLGWYTAAWDFDMSPNPESEWLVFWYDTTLWETYWQDYLAGGGSPLYYDWWNYAYVDQIVLDTWCTVPEPLTLSLLAVGGVALLRRRR